MLYQRVFSALILIVLVVLALFYFPFGLYSTFLVIIVGLSAFEWAQFVKIKSCTGRVLYALCYAILSVILLFFVFYFDSENTLLLQIVLYVGLIWWIVATLLVLTYPKSATLWSSSNVLISCFGAFSLLPFFVAMIQLRLKLPMLSSIEPNSSFILDYQGGLWVLCVLVLIWATDTGAYFAGRAFGKHKMAPAVSPKKTIEGLIGGLVLALIIAALIYYSTNLFNSMSAGRYFTCAFFAIVISVLGDLTESMFKREAQIKDSGKIIPGHGGILDRIDSLVAAIPVFVALFYLLGS